MPERAPGGPIAAGQFDISAESPEKFRVTEARHWVEALPGNLTFNDLQDRLRDELLEQFGTADSMGCSIWIRDMTDEWVVYEVSSGTDDELYQVNYSIDDTGAVTVDGDPVNVDQVTTFVPDTDDVTEAVDTVPGRVLEAKGSDSTGGRIFSVQVVEAGISQNGMRYSESVLTAAAPLYEGAKAYDHHRTMAELTSSTVVGLVGHYSNVQTNASGVTADLHLLPSASHTAEALDASLAAQAKGLPPIVGISHDVQMSPPPTSSIVDGRRISEATTITRVLYADVVADPSAGGRVTRMVAGGIGTEPIPNPKATAMNLKELLTALREANAEKRAELLKEHGTVLEAAGYTPTDVPTLLGEETTTETPTAEAGPTEAKEPVAAGVTESRITEAAYAKAGLGGRRLIADAVADAKLDPRFVEAVTKRLPDSFTETDVVRITASIIDLLPEFEKADLGPSVPHVDVTGEAFDKKKKALDDFFDPRSNGGGYRSIKEAYIDITGHQPKYGLDAADFNRQILGDSFGVQGNRYNGMARATESVDTSQWDVILGDSITRRMVAEYSQPTLQTWRQITSSIVPITDFRTQRVDRLGGYGVLPTVPQGGAYQSLTSPTDEEATGALVKKGGLEDLTLEAIADDDLRVVQRIPMKLGLAAARSLFNDLWGLLNSNATATYDSTALFHTNHANTATSLDLGQTSLQSARKAMAIQAAYGDSSDILAIQPKILAVPAALYDIAWQLCTSAVALPTSTVPAPAVGAANTPNPAQGMTPIEVPLFDATSATTSFVIADPNLCPTLEVGFYQGRQEPELFVQSDPTVGSAFNADKITYKIRFIYYVMILEHRGMYRMQH